MKKLNRKDLFFLAMGCTIGAGIITNTGIAIGMSGSGVIIAYFLACLIMFVTNLPIMLYTTVYPVMSPAYHMTAVLNKKIGGFWFYCQFAGALAQAYMGVAFGTYLNSIIPAIDPNVAGCVIVTLFFGVNLLDLKTSAKVQNVTTAVLLLVIGSFIVLGVPKCDFGQLFSREGLLYGGAGGIFNAVSAVLFGVGGSAIVMNFGPQMEDPKRNIPLMTIISFICAFFVFGLVAFVGAGVAPLDEVAGQPMTYQAQLIYPGNGYLIFVIGGALLAITTTINGNYQRYWSSIIRGVDDGWLPKIMGKRNKYGIPWVLMIVFWLMALIPNLLRLDIMQLNGLASSVTLIPLLINNWGFVKLPEVDPKAWKASKISKYFASATLRIALCGFCTILMGIFVVLNLMRFTKVMVIFVAVYFAVALVICIFFGDKLMANGENRAISENSN